MLAYPIRAMGVEKELLRAGTGPKPVAGQKVTVHCTGFGKDGDLAKKFWSTKDPGQQPFSFQIGQGKVIKGWDEGVLGMQVEKLLDYDALLTMHMVQVVSRHGVFSPTQFWFLRSRFSGLSDHLINPIPQEMAVHFMQP
ncbi:UNVERIFIED_CONTAM: Peptidyl-prolyl cis-trans isomerase FKBP12 [Sesamum latifolium]|uniref:peptidylprolyl isomerase n=1 Tax=Sesamum latifolium TaxID=2727402 RepID=A0AAW2XLE0_9LAMI